MFSKTRLLAGGGLALWVATAAAAPVPKDKALQLMMRPGAWIEADGALQPDGKLLANEFEVYAASHTAELEAPAIYGAISDINHANRTMRVLGYVVVWDAQTTLKDDSKRQILKSGLEDGMGVKVQGTLMPNGTFKASKIKAQSNKIRNGMVQIKEKVLGPVTVLDARAGAFRVLNTTISTAPNAAFDQVIPSAATP